MEKVSGLATIRSCARGVAACILSAALILAFCPVATGRKAYAGMGSDAQGIMNLTLGQWNTPWHNNDGYHSRYYYDYDTHRFRIDSPSLVTVYYRTDKASNWHNHAAALELYSEENGGKLFHEWDTYTDGTGCTSSNFYLPAGEYYIDVYGVDDDVTWGYHYGLKVVATAVSYCETEPNKEQSAADVLKIGKTYQAAFKNLTYYYYEDLDHYRFYLPKRSKVTINLAYTKSNYKNKIATMRLVNNNTGNYVFGDSTAYSNGTGCVKTLTLPKGDYSLQVYCHRDNVSWGKKYKISVKYNNYPYRPTMRSVTGQNNAITVKWKASSDAQGYQIRYSTSKNFNTYGTKTVANRLTVSKKITDLKHNRRYYAKVRSYRVVNGTKYYSGWTGIWTAKTK